MGRNNHSNSNSPSLTRSGATRRPRLSRIGNRCR